MAGGRHEHSLPRELLLVGTTGSAVVPCLRLYTCRTAAYSSPYRLRCRTLLPTPHHYRYLPADPQVPASPPWLPHFCILNISFGCLVCLPFFAAPYILRGARASLTLIRVALVAHLRAAKSLSWAGGGDNIIPLFFSCALVRAPRIIRCGRRAWRKRGRRARCL